jgi:DNA (cytosine-5)-methyltransferase 1
MILSAYDHKRRPLLLDLFCGAGGCAMGYHRAGFDVVGVDHLPQPHYPFEFIQVDAMSFLYGRRMDQYAAIHASPPCQAYSAMARCVKTLAPRLIPELRRHLIRIGLPYVIENVEGAPLQGNVVKLCGTMFPGVRVRRHRIFELSDHLPLILTPPCDCTNGVIRGTLIGHRCGGKVAPGRIRPPAATESERRSAIGVEWMSGREARQAIPPAYTEFIGRQLLEVIR